MENEEFIEFSDHTNEIIRNFNETTQDQDSVHVDTLKNLFASIYNTFNTDIIQLDRMGIKEIHEEQARDLHFERSAKLLRNKYSVKTHRIFAETELKRIPLHELKRIYSNYVIVIDEVQQLITHKAHTSEKDEEKETKLTKKQMEENYEYFYNFLHCLDNRKIVLMSGTPMVDQAHEIIPIMNLILPEHKRLDVKVCKSILTSNGNTFPQDYLDMLSNYYKGRISYLKAKTNIKHRFIGDRSLISRFVLYETYMSEYQSNVYDSIIETSKFNEEKSEASLFVYPYNHYGMEGYKGFVVDNKRPDFINKIKEIESVQNKLNAIKEYSCKYANIIEHIINENNERKNFFILTSSISGSGAIILGYCLECFGFNRIYGKKSKENMIDYKGYAILSEVNAKSTSVDRLRKMFNDSKNMYGKYIRVLIGGKGIAVGYSFHNVQQIHVITPHWNYSTLEQGLRRALRAFSHEKLQKANPHQEIIVDIFLHVAVGLKQNIDIEDYYIDVKKYLYCSNKDYPIKQIEYMIKTTCFDCPLMKKRNLITDSTFNDQRECEYKPCDYECKDLQRFDTDYSTYQIYYSNVQSNEITSKIKDLFRRQNDFTLEELLDMLSEYTIFSIMQSLIFLIEKSVQILNKYEMPSYLNEYNNIYYLTNTLSNNNTYLTSFYNNNPVLSEYANNDFKFADFIKEFDNSVEALSLKVNKICRYKNNVDKFISLIETSNHTIKESFIESAIECRRDRCSERNLVHGILQNFKHNVQIKTENGERKYYSRLFGKDMKLDFQLDEKEPIELDEFKQVQKRKYKHIYKPSVAERQIQIYGMESVETFDSLLGIIKKALVEPNIKSIKNVGSNPIGLSKKTYIEKVLLNIYEFYVTDKADGTRSFLIIKSNNMFFISGSTHSSESLNEGDQIPNMIIECEVVLVDNIPLILLYDVIAYSKEDRMHTKTFEERYERLKAIYELYFLSYNHIKLKIFYELDKNNYGDIINQCYNVQYPYNIDGLIFTEKYKDYKQTNNYKWKPPNLLTIDFLTLLYDNKTFYLFSNINQSMKDRLGLMMNKDLENFLMNQGMGYNNNKSFPMLFTPCFYNVPNTYIFPISEYKGEGDEYKSLDNKICEYKWQNNKWQLERIRHDKQKDLDERRNFGNFFTVAELTYWSIFHPLEFYMLSLPYDQLIQDVYFKKSDPIYKNARDYNSHVKFQIINKYCKKQPLVIDLASGKGQDLYKYNQNSIANLICVENDEYAIEELISRRYTAKPYNMNVKVMQLNLNDNYDLNLQKVKSNFYNSIPQSKVVMCNFAMHYFTTSLDKYINIANFVNGLLHVRGKFIFTCLDKDVVLYLLQQHGGKWKPTERYFIEYINNDTISILNPFSDEPQIENLVDIETLNSVFEQFNIKHVSTKSFTEFTRNYKKMNKLDSFDIEYTSLYSVFIYEKLER